MKSLKKISMTNQTMIAMVLGIAAGLIFGPAIAPIAVIGQIFLRLIQMAVVVMIMGAVIEAVGTLDPQILGKLGGKMAGWFLGGTAIAATLGLALGYLIQPGAGVDMQIDTSAEVATATGSVTDVILAFFPSNVVQSMSTGNMIQVIIFALLFGLSISLLSTRRDLTALKAAISQFNEVILQLVTTVMHLAPLGIFALLANVTGVIGLTVILPLAKFLLAMAIGSVIFLVLWIFLTSAITKVNPAHIVKGLSRMTIMAFTTTSSAITLPVKMEDQENKLGVSRRISQLVGPLGMAMNSNGLSLFLAIAAITLAQFYGLEFTLANAIQTVTLSTLATLGTVAVPGGGLVALTIVIPALGLPPESIGLLAGIDWFSGMFRTVLNVDADATIAMILAHGEGELDHQVIKELNANQATDVS